MSTNFFDENGNHVGKRCSAGNGQMAFIFNKNTVIFPGQIVTDECGNEVNFDEIVKGCAVVSEQSGAFC